jgi:hypothetical protein|tara:strand:- start:477 stop:914 length:438 start_codon:yes stop_codon:yes gene_type:complete
MKDDHKNMLLGFLAAKSRSSKNSSSLYARSHENLRKLNTFQKIWTWPLMLIIRLAWVAWILLLVVVIVRMFNSELSQDLIKPFWFFIDGRETILFYCLIFLAWFIFNRIIKKLIEYPRVLFWLTFSPFFLLFLYYMLLPLWMKQV